MNFRGENGEAPHTYHSFSICPPAFPTRNGPIASSLTISQGQICITLKFLSQPHSPASRSPTLRAFAYTCPLYVPILRNVLTPSASWPGKLLINKMCSKVTIPEKPASIDTFLGFSSFPLLRSAYITYLQGSLMPQTLCEALYLVPYSAWASGALGVYPEPELSRAAETQFTGLSAAVPRVAADQANVAKPRHTQHRL